MLADYDGAFIGFTDSDNDASYTFQVEEWLKGSPERQTIEIEKDAEDDTCGFSAGRWQSVAVLFNEDESGRFHSNTCGTVDPKLIEAALSSVEVNPDAGPGTLLVADLLTETHLWLLDDEGRIAAVASAQAKLGRDKALMAMEQCPDSTLVVEAWHGTSPTLVVRETATMEVTRTVPLSHGSDILEAVACMDPLGGSIAVLSSSYGRNNTIVDPDTDRVIAVLEHGESPFALSELSSELGMAVHLSNTGMRTIDLKTGEIQLVDALEQFVDSQVRYEPFGVSSISLNGTRFGAYFNELVGPDGDVKPGLLTYDLVSGEVWWESFWGPGTDSIAWLGTGEAWIGGDGNGPALVDVDRREISMDEDAGDCGRTCDDLRVSQLSGDQFFVVRDGSVIKVDRPSFEETTLAEIPITLYAQVLPLDPPVTVTRATNVISASAPSVQEQLPTAEPDVTLDDAPASEEFDGDGDDQVAAGADSVGDVDAVRSRWLFGGAALAVLLVASLGAVNALNRKKRAK